MTPQQESRLLSLFLPDADTAGRMKLPKRIEALETREGRDKESLDKIHSISLKDAQVPLCVM